MATSTGYGPSDTNWRSIHCNGLAESYNMWEVRFLNYLYTLDPALQKAILPAEPGVKDDADYDIKNKRAFAEMVQRLDERSLHLVVTDANNNARGSLNILRNYYASSEKPRILTLYEELTTLRMNADEDVTDYIIRAERAANGLNTAGEKLTDNLIIAMMLKGLPEPYKPFVVIQAHMDKSKSLSEFKASLRNYANNEAIRPMQHTLMKTNARSFGNQRTGKTYSKKNTCHSCGGNGHSSNQCKKKDSLHCNFCHKRGHTEKVCFRKSKEQNQYRESPTTASTTFSFMINDGDHHPLNLLVDCGATTHIVNTEDQFVKFDSNFDATKHFVETADGRRSNEIAVARGDAKFTISDANNRPCTIILKNALLAPKFPTSLFSVKAAIENGASIIFYNKTAELHAGETTFKFVQQGNLYFMLLYND